MVLVALLSYHEHIIGSRKNAKDAAIDRALTILDALETSATRESLSRFIFSVGAQPSVRAIAMVDDEQRVVLASKRAWQGRNVSDLNGVIDQQWLSPPGSGRPRSYWDRMNTQVVVVAPINLVNPASSSIRALSGGELLFVLDARPYVLEARTLAYFDAAWSGGVLLIIMALLARTLHVYVGRPLEILYRRANHPEEPNPESEPLKVGRIRELKVLASAISELADTRVALVKEKERLVDIADTVPGVIYEYRHYSGGEGEFSYLSEGIDRLLELEEQSMQNLPPALKGQYLWSSVEPADHDIIRQATERANYPSPGEWEAEFRLRTNDGIRWIWGHAVPVQDNLPGQLFRGVMLDITPRKELEKRLEQAATHDPLTGALNRAGIEPSLESSLADAQRNHRPMSVVLLDIDHFKQVNDTYGHALGDSVLVQLVSVIQHRVRNADSLSRWGGEEFLVLLPDTDKHGARQLAEELRQSVEQAVFEDHLPLTISLGVATVNADDSLKSLIRRADQHLYAAKHAGRNQTVDYAAVQPE
ncbi:MAG: diguanylate cyclase [Pseudomonadota bacterium]